MQHHKIGLIAVSALIVAMSLAGAAMGADASPKVEWTLDSNGTAIKLGQSSYSFTGNGASCKIGAVNQTVLDNGKVSESRMVRCSNLPPREIQCSKNTTEGFVEYGDFRLSCNTK